MSLNIYRNKSDIPDNIKLVTNNDLFFNAETSIKNTELAADILMKVDKAKYNSSLTFIGRTQELGALNKSMLSTGTKVLLNVIEHQGICFNIVECGDNALEFIPKIRTGYVLWELPVLAYKGDPDCDITYKGTHYTDFYKFLYAVEREERD